MINRSNPEMPSTDFRRKNHAKESLADSLVCGKPERDTECPHLASFWLKSVVETEVGLTVTVASLQNLPGFQKQN